MGNIAQQGASDCRNKVMVGFKTSILVALVRDPRSSSSPDDEKFSLLKDQSAFFSEKVNA